MKKFFVVALIAVALALASVATACKDGGDEPPVDNPIQDRSGTVKIFDGASTVTVQVKGMTTKAEWDVIAGKIAGRLNGYYNDNESLKTLIKEVFDRDVIYIIEPNPVGYNNFKLNGDGQTVYIALDKIDTIYVENAVAGIYSNGSDVS